MCNGTVAENRIWKLRHWQSFALQTFVRRAVKSKRERRIVCRSGGLPLKSPDGRDNLNWAATQYKPFQSAIFFSRYDFRRWSNPNSPSGSPRLSFWARPGRTKHTACQWTCLGELRKLNVPRRNGSRKTFTLRVRVKNKSITSEWNSLLSKISCMRIDNWWLRLCRLAS